jgi:hypothetical protein
MTSPLLEEIDRKRAELIAATDVLEVIADWQAELQARISRKMLVFQLADMDTDPDDLIEEVGQFRRVCRGLAWRQAKPAKLKAAA